MPVTGAPLPPYTPSAGRKGPSRHELLEPPPRGDHLAERWWFFGIATYAIIAGIFLGSLLANGHETILDLIGLGGNRNWALFVLIVGGFMLTVTAMKHGLDDIRVMRREELDIQWLIDKGTEGVGLVFADPSERVKLFKAGERFQPPDQFHRVETIVDHRVWRTRSASGGTSTMSSEAARAIADRRIARLGSFTRYTSSLLLLVAVLGTFAGVKSALPGLIDAVSASNSLASATGLSTLIPPLRAVADAFGGNALALIGAISVGLIAEGIGAGRRNLLERLELVSEAYIYDRTVTSGDDNPITRAMVELRSAATSFSESTGRLQGIETGLVTLGSDFRGAIRTLEDRLADIVEREQGSMYDRTSTELAKLHSTVTSLATSTRAQVDLYRGLVDSLGERSRESKTLIESTSEANKQIARVIDGVSTIGNNSKARLEELETTNKALITNSAELHKQVEVVSTAITALGQTLGVTKVTFTDAAEKMGKLGSQAEDAWRDMIQVMADAFQQMLDEHHESLKTLNAETLGSIKKAATTLVTTAVRSPAGGSTMGGDVAEQLDRVTELLEERPTHALSAWLLVLLPMLGAVAGGAALLILAR